MARITFFGLLLLLTFKLLTQTSHASWLPRGSTGARSVKLVGDAIPATTADAEAQIGFLRTELVKKLSLRDSAIRLLAAQDHSIAKRSRGRDETLEEIQQQLDRISDRINDLIELLSSFTLLSSSTATIGSASITSSSTQTATSTVLATATVTSSSTSTVSRFSTSSSSTSASTDASTATSGSTAASLSASTSASTSASAPAYSFQPMSETNVAVYYGQTAESATVPLSTICDDPNVDIIILAFVNILSTGPAGLPGLNLGPKCWGPTAAQASAGGAALVDCVSNGFSEEVKTCQASGKKLLLSVGGARDYSQTTIASEQDAVRIADNIWKLFGPAPTGNATLTSLRPFGDFVFDGFDIDNEDGSTQYWSTLISTLRNYFQASPSKPYYMAAAPQCPRPDASIPLVSLRSSIDFIFIQFYNNAPCNLNSIDPSGFLNSLRGWSQDVSASGPSFSFVQTANGVTSPRVFVGAPAFPGAANAGGFVGMPGFTDLMDDVKALVMSGELDNFGGVMIWDGANGELSSRTGGEMGTTGTGKTWMQLAKEKLA